MNCISQSITLAEHWECSFDTSEGGGGETAILCLKWIGSSYPGELPLSQLLTVNFCWQKCNCVCSVVEVRVDGIRVSSRRCWPLQSSHTVKVFKRGRRHRWESSQLTVCEMNVISLFFFITNTNPKQIWSPVVAYKESKSLRIWSLTLSSARSLWIILYILKWKWSLCSCCFSLHNNEGHRSHCVSSTLTEQRIVTHIE